MDCMTMRGSLASGWAAVTRIWLDENASRIQRRQIDPLLQMLDEAIALNEEESQRAASYLEEASSSSEGGVA